MRRSIQATLGAAGLVIAITAFCEWQGWPFLAKPAERWLAARLQRTVSLEDDVSLHLLGGISIHAGHLQVGNPAWSSLGPVLVASDATLKLHWRDMLGFARGNTLRHRQRLARHHDRP